MPHHTTRPTPRAIPRRHFQRWPSVRSAIQVPATALRRHEPPPLAPKRPPGRDHHGHDHRNRPGREDRNADRQIKGIVGIRPRTHFRAILDPVPVRIRIQRIGSRVSIGNEIPSVRFEYIEDSVSVVVKVAGVAVSVAVEIFLACIGISRAVVQDVRDSVAIPIDQRSLASVPDAVSILIGLAVIRHRRTVVYAV